jgi:hypothetical protein
MLNDYLRNLDLATKVISGLAKRDAYRRLTGADGHQSIELRGVSKTRYSDAIDLIPTLYDCLDRLSAHMEKVVKLRRRVSYIGDETALEVDALLRKATITLPSTAAVSLRTHAGSGELRGAMGHDSLEIGQGAFVESKVTPAQLFEVMMALFAKIKDAVTALDKLWTDLPSMIDKIRDELMQIQNLETLPPGTRKDAASLCSELNDLQFRLHSDPVGLKSDLDTRVATRMQRLRSQVKESGLR